MKKNEVFEIIDKFQASNLSFFSWEQNEEKLILEKKIEKVSQSFSSDEGTKLLTKIEEEDNQSATDKIITAPLVGTFYGRPSPDSIPFVQVGQEVREGDVVGIIEAMKLMNEIKAKEDGIVSRILVEDGKLVEFQQGLIVLEDKKHV